MYNIYIEYMPFIKEYFNINNNIHRPFILEFIAEVNILKQILEIGKVPLYDSVDIGNAKCIDLHIENGNIIIEDSEEDEVVFGKVILSLWTEYPRQLIHTIAKYMSQNINGDMNMKLITDSKTITIGISNGKIIKHEERIIENKLIKRHLENYLIEKVQS